MTQKHVLTVDFKDIKALEVTCKCGAQFTIPVPKDSLPANIKCAGCNERLWDASEDREFQFVNGLLIMLSHVQRHDDRFFRLGFSLDMPEKR
jgi:hypothetical protein